MDRFSQRDRQFCPILPAPIPISLRPHPCRASAHLPRPPLALRAPGAVRRVKTGGEPTSVVSGFACGRTLTLSCWAVRSHISSLSALLFLFVDMRVFHQYPVALPTLPVPSSLVHPCVGADVNHGHVGDSGGHHRAFALSLVRAVAANLLTGPSAVRMRRCKGSDEGPHSERDYVVVVIEVRHKVHRSISLSHFQSLLRGTSAVPTSLLLWTEFYPCCALDPCTWVILDQV